MSQKSPLGLAQPGPSPITQSIRRKGLDLILDLLGPAHGLKFLLGVAARSAPSGHGEQGDHHDQDNRDGQQFDHAFFFE